MVRGVANRFGPRANGFTLAEAVLVVAIVAILGALLSPRYAGTVTRFKAEGAARRVSADLALAQRHARMNGAARRVVFDPVTHGYTLIGVPDPENAAVDYAIDLSDETYNARLTAVELGGDAEIRFDGYGMPDSGGTVTLSVGTEARTVTVDADTGRVETPKN